MVDYENTEVNEVEDALEGASFGDFVVDGESYVVSFTAKRVKLFESSNRPIMAVFATSGGTMSLEELEALLAYGLRKEGSAFVNPRKGMEVAERLVEEKGYFPVYETVIDALGRDCDFLFRGMPMQ